MHYFMMLWNNLRERGTFGGYLLMGLLALLIALFFVLKFLFKVLMFLPNLLDRFFDDDD